MKVALTRISAAWVSSMSMEEKTMKKGTAVATGGRTRCDRNQIVRSLFLMRLKRKRASA